MVAFYQNKIEKENENKKKMKTFVAIPYVLTFNLDEDFHSVNIAAEWGNWERKLAGNVKAVLGNGMVETANKLIAKVREHVHNFPDFKDGKVRIKDFTLRFSVEEVKNGEFWSQSGARIYNLQRDFS